MMICKNCGYSNDSSANNCVQCGAVLGAQDTYQETNQNPYQDSYPDPNQESYQHSNQESAPGQGFAIASMVCGIVSFFCFGIIAGTLGIVFGVVARSQGNRSNMTIAGIVCGAIGIVLWLAGILILGILRFSLVV